MAPSAPESGSGVRGGGVEEPNKTPPPGCDHGTDWVTHVALMQDLEHFVDVVEGMYPGGPSLFGLKKRQEKERERARLGQRVRLQALVREPGEPGAPG